eukprot:gb/GFBE01039250.1/.p1 GENE.gb/GFBE01039250.1/~~gb/GFBE01039250.1/.p1  ORF type:complete len:303 (+),score=67.50 gb/GFBE01039250.1/:1-909(+)
MGEAPGHLRLFVTLLSGEKACVEVHPDDTIRKVKTMAQMALSRPLIGLALSQAPMESPLPPDSTVGELGLVDGSVVATLVGRLRVHATRFAFAACQGDGSVVAWGSPFAGGDAAEVVDHLADDVQEVASNLMAFAAVKADGSIVAWGHSSCGGQPSEEVQDKLRSGGGVRKIFSTNRAFAALKRDGSVVCWGCLYHGARFPEMQSPAVVSKIYSAPRGAFAAVTTTGAVIAWGHEAAGGDCQAVTHLLQDGVQQVFSNDSAFAALRGDGSVVTWGSASHGGDTELVRDKLAGSVQKDGSVVC